MYQLVNSKLEQIFLKGLGAECGKTLRFMKDNSQMGNLMDMEEYSFKMVAIIPAIL